MRDGGFEILTLELYDRDTGSENASEAKRGVKVLLFFEF